MAVTIAIGGTDKSAAVLLGSLRITKDDAVETCSFTTRGADLTVGAYRPALGATVRIEQDSYLLFGGTVDEVRDRASDGLNAGVTEVDATCVGYHVLPTYVSVTATYVAGADLLEVADDLCDILGTYYGVTNVGADSGGPILPAISWDHVPVADALQQLVDFSGGVYQWRINGDKGFAMAVAGDISGPTFTDSNARVIRSFGWSRSRTKRATRVYAKCGKDGDGSTARTQRWIGDGTRTAFYLDVEPSVAPVKVTENESTEYSVPGALWTYDPVRCVLLRDSALPGSDTADATYTVTFPAWCKAEIESELDAGHLYEAQYHYPDVTVLDTGVALAQGILDQQRETPKRVTLQTLQTDIYPWMTCNLSFATRTISGDYLVRRVAITSALGVAGTRSNALLYEVELWETAGRTWRDYWTRIGGAAMGGLNPRGVSVISGGASHVWGNDRRGGEISDTWVPVSNYLDWVAPDGDEISVIVERRTDDADTTVTARIYDLTASAAAKTGTATSATSWTEEVLTFTPISGHKYQLQVVGSDTGAAVYCVGRH